uniref:Mediator complex subunit Med12 LCEWAV-domain domain-containing protein n=1 Tax=Ditylenchus dipsaci TaxID=166011 RepID=A0A915DDE1_9BILA
MRKRHYRSTAFGTHQLQDLLIDYLNKEAPTPDSVHFRQEFSSLMLLFYELQRFNLFNHDAYVRAPEQLVAHLSSTPSQVPQPVQEAIVTPSATNPSIKTEVGEQPPAIISFIPTTSTSLPVSVAGSATTAVTTMDSKASLSSTSLNEDSAEEYASLLPLPQSLDQASNCPQMYMEKPVELSAHERFLIQLPIEQNEEWRDACNQRSILLYGISDERELARQELRKIALQICRIWQRKLNVEFFHNSKEVRFKRRVTTEIVGEALSKFKSQTYYDQLVICGWCTESLMDMFREFFQCTTLVLPTSECLDMLCFMLESCGDLHELLTLAVELIPKLIRLEKVLATFHSDCMPGTIACQLAYVIVGYLAEHFYYFLYSKEASTIVNGLYRVVEKELCAVGYPITGWPEPLQFSSTTAGKIFPESGAGLMPEDLKYNSLLLTDFLKEPRRFYCYHDYKLHLPSIEDAHTRYSFVVNAFLAARNSKRDYDRLAELSNICGHVSVQKPMAGEWCVAIQELCYSSVSVKSGYSHLIREINVNDPSTHYSLSTFVVLLASKYCFSAHALLLRLLNNVLVPIIKADNLAVLEGSEMGLCLALQIISSIVCATDIPFNVNCELESTPSNSANKAQSSKKLLEMRNADLRALKIVHIRELDACIFPLLSAVGILMDMLKKKIDQSSSNSSTNVSTLHRLNCLHSVVKCSLLAMCEQEWVISRVFRICETQKNMDAFNCSRLKDDIGQLLLRLALRRRNERQTKEDFMQLRGDEATIKKARFDKLLSTMSLWNMRATFYDFKLMIKEISPDIPQKASSATMVQAHHQRSFLANRFITDIGMYCKELFVNCKREDYYRGPFSQSTFRFHHINCYWLIAPLISVCPKPDNIPQMVTGSMTVTVKAKFLDEAASILDGVNGSHTQLLGQQPFLNLILTCIQGEEIDNLVGSLLRHIQAIIGKAKENPTLPYQSQFAVEREGLLLRLNLVGGIFDSLLQTNGSSEPWALALFQLMFYEIIAADRDKQYFDVCFDMLSTLVHSMMTSSNSQSAYNGLVRKIRKELGDRPIPPDLNCLAQLLPINKSRAELTAWESFSSANSPQKTSSKSSGAGSANSSSIAISLVNGPLPKATRLDKHPQLVQRQLMRLLYHNHYVDYPAPGLLGADHQQQQRIDRDIYLQTPNVEYYLPERGEDEDEGLLSPSSSSSNPSNLGHPPQQAGHSIFPSSSSSAMPLQHAAQSNASSVAQSENALKAMKSTSCFQMLQGGGPKEAQQQQHRQFDGAHMQMGNLSAAPPLPTNNPAYGQPQQQPPPQMKFEVGTQPPQQQPKPMQQQPGMHQTSHLLNQQQPGLHHPQGIMHPNSSGQVPHPLLNHPSSMDPSTSSMFTNHQPPGGIAAAAVAGYLHQGMHQDQQQRSGSSTPTILGVGPSTSSPQRGVGRGGGRRKNPATAGPTTSTGRGQKRKKLEAGPSKGLPPMDSSNMMGMGHSAAIPPHLLHQQQQANYMAWQQQQMQQQQHGQGHPQQQQQQFIGQQQQFQQQRNKQQQQQQKQQQMMSGVGGMPQPQMPHMQQQQQGMMGMMCQPDATNQMQLPQQQGQMSHVSDSKHNLQQKLLQKMSAQQQQHQM